MATYTKTVDPNGGADYASLALWEAGEASLYTATDTAVANCKRTGALKDNGNSVSLAAFVSVPQITVDPLHRHEGRFADTRASDGNYIYTIDIVADWTGGVNLDRDDSLAEWLTVNCNAGYQRKGLGTDSNKNRQILRNNIVYNTGHVSSPNTAGIVLNSSQNARVYNNVVIGNGSGKGIYIEKWYNGGVYNNTVYGCTENFYRNVSTGRAATLSNNISAGATIADYGGDTANITGSNNVSSDGTALGTSPATGKTDYATYFVDHLAGDLRLNTSSRELFGIDAADLSATFAEDNVGKARPASSRFGLGAWRSQEWRTTVDPNGGADYASIALWEAGEQGLYTSGDIAVADCLRTGALKDTSVASISGWVAGVSARVIVNNAHRHEGKIADTRESDGNYVYTLDSSGDGLRYLQHNIIIDGLVALVDARGFWTNTPFAIRGCFISNNIIKSKNGAANGAGVIEYGVLGDTSVYNNIIVGFNGTGGRGISMSSAPRDIQPFVYNNTVYDCETGILADSDQIVSNNIILNCTTCYSGAVFTGSTYNVSSDGTALGTSPATNKTAYTDYFVDPANSDFRLKADSETLFGIASADLSATFTDDAVGETRPASSLFGLGPLLYVASEEVDVTPTISSVTVAAEDPGVASGAATSPTASVVTSAALDPFIAAGASVNPPVSATILSANDPVIETGATVAPTTAAITNAAHDPTVVVGAVVTPDAAIITNASGNPGVSAGAAINVTSADTSVATEDPVVATGAVVAPSISAASMVVNDPTVTSGAGVVPTVAIVTATGEDPVVQTPGSTEVVPTVGVMTAAANDPVVSGGVNVSPDVAAVTTIALTPAVGVGALVAPTTSAMTSVANDPFIATGVVVLPTVASISAFGLNPTLATGASVSLDVSVASHLAFDPLVVGGVVEYIRKVAIAGSYGRSVGITGTYVTKVEV